MKSYLIVLLGILVVSGINSVELTQKQKEKKAVCYHARDGIYPKEFRNESFFYDESEYWKRTDDQIMTMCKIKHLYRPQDNEYGKIAETTEVYYVTEGNSTKKVTKKKYKWKTTSKAIKNESNSTKSANNSKSENAYENIDDVTTQDNLNNDYFFDKENNDNHEVKKYSDTLKKDRKDSTSIELSRKSNLESSNSDKPNIANEKIINKAPEVKHPASKCNLGEKSKKENDHTTVNPLIIIPIIIPMNVLSEPSAIKNSETKVINLKNPSEFCNDFSNIMNKNSKEKCFSYCDEKHPLHTIQSDNYKNPMSYLVFTDNYPFYYLNNRFSYQLPHYHQPHYKFFLDNSPNYPWKSNNYGYNPNYFHQHYFPYYLQ